jgi:hypothetical protein
MVEPLSYTERRLMIDKYLTEVSLFAKDLCPTATVEATLTSYENEDGQVRIHPPADLTASQIAALEGQVAGRCVDLLIQTGIFLCAAVYAPDLCGIPFVSTYACRNVSKLDASQPNPSLPDRLIQDILQEAPQLRLCGRHNLSDPFNRLIRQ